MVCGKNPDLMGYNRDLECGSGELHAGNQLINGNFPVGFNSSAREGTEDRLRAVYAKKQGVADIRRKALKSRGVKQEDEDTVEEENEGEYGNWKEGGGGGRRRTEDVPEDEEREERINNLRALLCIEGGILLLLLLLLLLWRKQ
ncbi:hypothetical protein WN55_01144 [Dufourea novaeangliae]|uniref:Uncharacterized protein n=1 Tax=Dufourea novaeangliae TaxID=178035 RepID=A0A154PE98_DUFNO|nr:hypothetical protein WN55_01144 [Dufourea novaeangliae]